MKVEVVLFSATKVAPIESYGSPEIEHVTARKPIA
jgi:hypothetical protein